MSERSPVPPTGDELRRLGVEVDRELHAGKQSRVFAGTVDGLEVVVKLTDARMVDRTTLAERMLMTEAVAEEAEAVVAPVRIDNELVHTCDGWLVTVTPFVDGRRAGVSVAADVRLLGRGLGDLHAVLGRLPERQLPPVAALDVDDGGDRSRWQLLHGDFNNQNVILTSTGLRIFDFDDCGYGPVLYDVANSLYMVLFDAVVNGDHDRYRAFRSPFLDGYADVSGSAVDVAVVDSLIDARVFALDRWLDDLASAPIGIRSSSPEWQQVLRVFVSTHRANGTAGSR